MFGGDLTPGENRVIRSVQIVEAAALAPADLPSVLVQWCAGTLIVSRSPGASALEVAEAMLAELEEYVAALRE